MARVIIVTGNPVDGLAFYGMFDSEQVAIEFAERELDNGDWWIAPLRLSGEDKPANPVYVPSTGGLNKESVSSFDYLTEEYRPLGADHVTLTRAAMEQTINEVEQRRIQQPMRADVPAPRPDPRFVQWHPLGNQPRRR